MAPHSKFLELLENNRVFLTEANFVKGGEKSELPPVGDFEEPEDSPVDQEQPDIDDGGSEDEVTDQYSNIIPWVGRDKDLLELSMKLYISYEGSPEKTRDIRRLWASNNYDQLYARLSQLDIVNDI
jgi:hypothetical protein